MESQRSGAKYALEFNSVFVPCTEIAPGQIFSGLAEVTISEPISSVGISR